MIRRDAGDAYYLIHQHDHALLSGALAGHIGNNGFDRITDPRAREAISLHDCGWPLHDDSHATLNKSGQPLDVFESPTDVAMLVWPESANRAQQIDRYVGLLVSLHVLNLSAQAMSHASFDQSNRRAIFELNRFQHAEVERQQMLREQLGMRTDLPLRFGLAKEGSDPKEDLLRQHFRFLQLLDVISLGLCCTTPPADQSGEVHTQVGASPVRLQLHCSHNVLRVDPWPFDAGNLAFEVPYRAVPKRTYADARDLQTVLADAPVQTLHVGVSRAS